MTTAETPPVRAPPLRRRPSRPPARDRRRWNDRAMTDAPGAAAAKRQEHGVELRKEAPERTAGDARLPSAGSLGRRRFADA
jgi:hypothetical protein